MNISEYLKRGGVSHACLVSDNFIMAWDKRKKLWVIKEFAKINEPPLRQIVYEGTCLADALKAMIGK